ncbi:hypothetical protein JHK87_001090 [Glycine soja]|nr:hypothetical protein JHK87_001090 [Glycine soja]
MEVKKEGPTKISTLITKQLGINCSILMGANIANEDAIMRIGLEETSAFSKIRFPSILKESSDGPDAVTIDQHETKSGLFDLKLTALDQHKKTILVNDIVRVLEGPTKAGFNSFVFAYRQNLVVLYFVKFKYSKRSTLHHVDGLQKIF